MQFSVGTVVRPVRNSQGRFSSLKSKAKYAAKWFAIRFAVAAGIGLFAFGTYLYGTLENANTQTAVNQIVIQQAPAVKFPILDRIAMAESHNSQYCTAALTKVGMCHSYEIGSVLIHLNTDGTYDIGQYQINSIHLSQAIKLGYDVYKSEDNKKFAEYLFETQGSEPWKSSRANWIN